MIQPKTDPTPLEKKVDKKPIFNVHTHVFTHEYVPPFLARSIVMWPFYYFIHVPSFVWTYIQLMAIRALKHKPGSKKIRKRIIKTRRYILQVGITRFLYTVFIIWIGTTAFFILFNAVDHPTTVNPSGFVIFMRKVNSFLVDWHLLFKRPEWFPQFVNVLFAVTILLLVKSVRKSILFLLNQVRSFLNLLPGEKTKALLSRYLMMARFALYNKQSGIFSRLQRQYPQDTKFIVLPMDMEYMGAGRLNKKKNYYHQMTALAALNDKKTVFPFIFIDPRRMRDKKYRDTFFKFSHENGKVTLEDSFVKHYIETEKFTGFKIYPALGYFPFDADLLPLWKYAADHGIPITTHGVKGVIYYRGWIKKEWGSHPVFTEFMGNDKRSPLYFTEKNNYDFQVNFTHPMNFLCLLEEPLLRKLVGEGNSETNKSLFGFTNMDTPLKYNLSQLKICYAHYGGAVEWNKFLNRDRDNYAQQLMTKPETGIDFGVDEDGEMPWGRYENVWKFTDWYSIISSMMIQYPNFYADISYIVSDVSLYPMLQTTISSSDLFENDFTKELQYESRDKLRKRVLFGSDFYLVRSQRSDKDIFMELQAALDEEEFDLIARDNPHAFLHGQQP